MKKIFTLSVLVCFSFGIATAQNKAAVKAETATKVESKEALTKAQVQPKKIDAVKIEQRASTVKRIDANNSRGIVLTQEQVETRAKKSAVKAKNNLRKADEK
jgi:hypothetical protein